jgi:hypothetical protein
MSTETREAPKRLRAADVIDQLQHTIDQLTTRTASEPSASVEITRNAAGNAQFVVKVYAPSSADEAEVKMATERAYNQATDAYDALCQEYPHTAPPKKPENDKAAQAAAAIARNRGAK